MICRYCRRWRGDADPKARSHYAECPRLYTVFGPPRRTCKRCRFFECAPGRLVCGRCARPDDETRRVKDRGYRVQKRIRQLGA